MKMDKNRKEEYKIARSEERVAARNAQKAERRALQGVKMFVSEEEAKAREKEGKKPIVPKKWKEDEKKHLLEARNLPRVKPKDFYSEELKVRRKAKRERLKVIHKKIEENFAPQAIFYPKFNKEIKSQIATQVEFDGMITRIKRLKATAKKQSKEDKAKYKASLVAFKKTYVRKTGTTKGTLAA